MPKGTVKIEPIRRDVFFAVLKAKNSSIRKLGNALKKPSEKTIRRQLNEKLGLRKKYIDQIARRLDVDPRLLTGRIVNDHPAANEKNWKKLFIEHIEDYPYSLEEQERLKHENIRETLIRILSLFDVPYSLFIEKSFDEQYAFQQNLLSSIFQVMSQHFPSNCTDRILFDLDNYYEDYYIQEYAEQVLRVKYLSSPPTGVTKKQIKKMTADELIGLDLQLKDKSHQDNKDEARLAKKYADYPTINCDL